MLITATEEGHTNWTFPFHHDASRIIAYNERHLIFRRSTWIQVPNEGVHTEDLVLVQDQTTEKAAIDRVVI